MSEQISQQASKLAISNQQQTLSSQNEHKNIVESLLVRASFIAAAACIQGLKYTNALRRFLFFVPFHFFSFFFFEFYLFV